MATHIHLVVRTPQPTLSRGIRLLATTPGFLARTRPSASSFAIAPSPAAPARASSIVAPDGRSPGPASVELHGDVLDLRVVLHRVRGHVLAVARLLVAAVRHLARQRHEVVVHPDGP